MNTNELHSVLTDGARPNCGYCQFGQRKGGVEIDKQVWSTPRVATKEVRLSELQWKILHNIYPTNILVITAENESN